MYFPAVRSQETSDSAYHPQLRKQSSLRAGEQQITAPPFRRPAAKCPHFKSLFKHLILSPELPFNAKYRHVRLKNAPDAISSN